MHSETERESDDRKDRTLDIFSGVLFSIFNKGQTRCFSSGRASAGSSLTSFKWYAAETIRGSLNELAMIWVSIYSSHAKSVFPTHKLTENYLDSYWMGLRNFYCQLNCWFFFNLISGSVYKWSENVMKIETYWSVFPKAQHDLLKHLVLIFRLLSLRIKVENIHI